MVIEFKIPGLIPIASVPKLELNSSFGVNFGRNPYLDTFQNNSVEKLFDENVIRKMIFQNLNLRQILKNNNIPICLNMKELNDLLIHHCKDTQNISVDIVKNLPQSLKDKVNIKDLKDGAMLHDFGKVLIPNQILNKIKPLTLQEHEIMDLHSQIGYELLKNTGVSDKVLKLVRYHHLPNFDINLQILNLADKYSALTEKRVYKTALSPKQTLTILYSDVKNGIIHPDIFKALVNSVKNNPVKCNVNIS